MKWRFHLLIIKMAGKTLHGMISYIKQILWRRRLLVALFADLAFCQLSVIKSADLKYQLHLFKGAINKKPWRLLKEPASSGCLLSLRTDRHHKHWGDRGWCWAWAAQHLLGQVFHMLTDLSFMLQDTRDFFIKRKPLFSLATNSTCSVRAGWVLGQMPEAWKCWSSAWMQGLKMNRSMQRG